MIVVCVNNKLYPDDLTIGKQYCILPFSSQNVVYTIINNNGKEFGYIKDRFIKLEDWREQQINKVLIC